MKRLLPVLLALLTVACSVEDTPTRYHTPTPWFVHATGVSASSPTRPAAATARPTATSRPAATSQPAATSTPAPQRMFVSASPAANVRSGPSESDRIVGTLPVGTEVGVYETRGEWRRIEHAQFRGDFWMHASVLSVSSAPTATSRSSYVLPTAVPRALPLNPGLSLTIASVTSPVRAGATASLSAQTAPGASCSITVYYKTGASTAKGLTPKQADGNGGVAWSWVVGTSTTAGSWRIVVTATKDGQSANAEAYFAVVR